jgi:predicted nucleotidyltransferase
MLAAEKHKVSFFSQRLHNRLRGHILRLVLYGSRARGDAEEGSDYDFLAIVDEMGSDLKEKIIDAEVEFLNAFDEVSACLVFDETGWEWMKNSPLGINIEKEGILV